MALASLLLVVAVLGAAAIYKHLRDSKKNRLPTGVQKLPGPKGLPIIGSVHEVPEKNSFTKFHVWGEKYGPIYQCNLAGTNHVWISRDNIAHDLLSKRSAIYSDRPHIPALEQDNRTSGQYLPLMSKNELWTRQRKFAKQIMDKSEKAAFYGYPELESVRMLFELMNDPHRYNHVLESFIARVTSRLAWGVSTPSDELKQRARELLIGVSPTGALPNKLPFLMNLPESWVPAKAWECRRSRTERKFFETMQNDVAAEIKATGKTETNVPSIPSTIKPRQSWMRTFLENKSSWGFASDLEGAYAVGMHGIAGALTIAAPMQSFCLAMCHYPQFQPILHEEIDRVLGDRMPSFSDLPDMPVLRAFIRETMRWRPPVPTGIPHQLIRDDFYEGYYIPAGSVIHPLEWSISRDPEVFPDPDAYNPLRWLDSKYPSYQEPLSKFPTITSYSQFGYGRRTCQGMAVTEADLFVGIGSIAWLFSMHAATEEVEAQEGVERHAAEEKASLPGKLVSWANEATGLPTGVYTPPDTPPDEKDVEFELDEEAVRRLTMLSNDWIPSIPGEFPGTTSEDDLDTPPPSPKRFPGTNSALAGRPGMPRVKSMFVQRPGTPTSSPKTNNAPSDKSDPTMDYSSLLIAKPNPFKFTLKIRNQVRAQRVARDWMDLKMDGEFPDSRIFWRGGNVGDEQHGWGEVSK